MAMKNSICPLGKDCGAFNNCKIRDFIKCGGHIAINRNAKKLFKKILPDFKIGKCSFCGNETKVSEVNKSIKACEECWISEVMPRRILEK